MAATSSITGESGCARHLQLWPSSPAVFDDGRLRVVDRNRLLYAGPASIKQSTREIAGLNQRSLMSSPYSDKLDCSTGTPGPMVEDTETLFR
jgi:hypothetical protein